MKSSLPQTLLVLVVVAGLVAVQQLFSLPGGTALMRATQDAMHAPWFFTVVVVLCWWLRMLAWPLRLLLVATLGTALAIGTEFAQIYVDNRSASVSDLKANMVGGLLGMVFAFAFIGETGVRFTSRAIGIGGAAVLALALYTAWSPWQALELRRYRAALAPVLVDFQDARAVQILSANEGSWFRIGTATADWPRYQGQPVLRLVFGESEYPTLYINELMQRWASYDALALDVFVLDSQPLPLTVAVQYEGSSGTSAYVESTLQAGENRLRISRSRFVPDDAKSLRVRDLLIYTTAEHAGRAVLLGDLRME